MVTNSILDTGDLEVKGKTKFNKGVTAEDVSAKDVSVDSIKGNTDDTAMYGTQYTFEGNVKSEKDIYAANFYGTKADSALKLVNPTSSNIYSNLTNTELKMATGTNDYMRLNSGMLYFSSETGATSQMGTATINASSMTFEKDKGYSTIFQHKSIIYVSSYIRYTLSFPANTGTLALTSDIPSVPKYYNHILYVSASDSQSGASEVFYVQVVSTRSTAYTSTSTPSGTYLAVGLESGHTAEFSGSYVTVNAGRLGITAISDTVSEVA